MFSHRRHDDEELVDPRAMLREATVVEVDLAAGTVVCETGEVRTAPVAFASGRAGATRIWSPPSVGEQVLLFCPDGDIERAVPFGAIPKDAYPPAGDGLTELIAFDDGARIAYDPEAHHLEFALPDGATVAILGTGGVSIDVGSAALAITGRVTIDGDASVTGKLECAGDILAEGVSLTKHRHLGVSVGQAQSGPPAS